MVISGNRPCPWLSTGRLLISAHHHRSAAITCLGFLRQTCGSVELGMSTAAKVLAILVATGPDAVRKGPRRLKSYPILSYPVDAGGDMLANAGAIVIMLSQCSWIATCIGTSLFAQ